MFVSSERVGAGRLNAALVSPLAAPEGAWGLGQIVFFGAVGPLHDWRKKQDKSCMGASGFP